MRSVRVTAPGVVHHVVSRFIEKRHFITSHTQRKRYLDLLARSMEKTDWVCLAYAVMSSHIHLAMLAGRQDTSWMRRVHPPFANWLNERSERIGPLFASRAKMWTASPQNVASLIAYIHNNPVRAKVVSRASASAWTSHRAYLGRVSQPWLGVEQGLALSGLERGDFDTWTHSHRHERLAGPDLERLRRAARAFGAIEMATPQREPLSVDFVARPFAWLRPDPRSIIDVTAEVLGVEAETLRQRRAPRASVGRAIAVKVGRSFGLSMAAVGAALGISGQAASRLGSRDLDDIADAARHVVYARVRDALTSALVSKGENVPT